jgi:hypothetical protein
MGQNFGVAVGEVDSVITPEELRVLLNDLDPLMIALGLACASITPGPPGYVGAIAAIAFDAKHKQWRGLALTAGSMIPLAGYLPGIVKVGWLLRALDRHLKDLEAKLPVLHQSDEPIALLRGALGKYHRSLPKIKPTQTLRDRLAHIMALDLQTDAAAETDTASIRTP